MKEKGQFEIRKKVVTILGTFFKEIMVVNLFLMHSLLDIKHLKIKTHLRGMGSPSSASLMF